MIAPTEIVKMIIPISKSFGTSQRLDTISRFVYPVLEFICKPPSKKTPPLHCSIPYYKSSSIWFYLFSFNVRQFVLLSKEQEQALLLQHMIYEIGLQRNINLNWPSSNSKKIKHKKGLVLGAATLLWRCGMG